MNKYILIVVLWFFEILYILIVCILIDDGSEKYVVNKFYLDIFFFCRGYFEMGIVGVIMLFFDEIVFVYRF